MDNNIITCDGLINLIHEECGISKKVKITPETLIEKGLGITGDDGVDLLRAIEKRFNICFPTDEKGFNELFGLAPDEYLFHSEGFNLRSFIMGLFGLDDEKVHPLSVGELYQAILKRTL